ncbi:MAG: alpha/beta hydrolase [Phenylobacterium sp.]|uniref:alpha/beta fold hydrolase n=1 Tax=Phenylobacterium sp. TaxID=1871053 RepID=UPI0027330940|nr:alpha/beta hydrolase [Phenylobacterium sp.]MDP3173302.1 alpha/beta hydrolase [Phenylobacterium sp.]
MANDQHSAPGRGLTDEDIIDIPGLASRWVRLADGRRAHYITAGDKGPAVVLFHGGIEGSSGTAGWRFMAPVLAAAGFRVYCPDQPGYGLSDVSNPAYLDNSIKARNDFAKMFMDALCIDKAHIAGNSMGCITCCNFVVSNPERVLSVMFIAGFLDNIDLTTLVKPSDGKFNPKRYSQEMREAVQWDGTEAGMQRLMDGIIYEPKAVWPELVRMRYLAATRQREARIKAGKAYGTPADVADGPDPNMQQIFQTAGRIQKLTIPMIYMYGMQDVILPVENGYMQEDYAPNIQFFYPQECGHQGQTDQPEIFNAAALEFFRDGKVSWPTAVKANVSLRRPIDPRVVQEPKSGFPKPNPGMYADPESLKVGLKAFDAVPA